MSTDLRSVDQRLSETARTNLVSVHDLFMAGMKELTTELHAGFTLKPHSSTRDLESYTSTDGAMRGSVTAYRGGDIDWMIDSWVGSPERGFTNHHLTVWLGPRIKAPHLGVAIGTIPQMFVYCDLVPRSDLWVDTDALDTYHAPLNDRFLQIEADDNFRPFVSRSPYIRQAMSPSGFCVEGEPSPDNIATMFSHVRAVVKTWIDYVGNAAEVPETERDALAARDAHVRRTICERDPANVVAEKVLGAEMTTRLVRTLWGADKDAK